MKRKLIKVEIGILTQGLDGGRGRSQEYPRSLVVGNVREGIDNIDDSPNIVIQSIDKYIVSSVLVPALFVVDKQSCVALGASHLEHLHLSSSHECSLPSPSNTQ